MTNLEIQEKLDLLNELEVIDYDGGDSFSVTVNFNEKTLETLLKLGFTEKTISLCRDKSEVEEKTIDLVPFASDLGSEEWEFCGGFAANMILHTQQALNHIQSGSRVTSRQSGESYALEDMEGHDLTFTLTELSGLWTVDFERNGNHGIKAG